MERCALANLYLYQFLPLWVCDVYCAGDARVEAVNRAQDFQGLLRIMHGVCILQGGFVGARLAIRVAWAGIPCAWNDGLVVGDLLVFNDNPM